jgi:hypothetical protein
MVCKKICKTIHLTPWGTATGTYRRGASGERIWPAKAVTRPRIFFSFFTFFSNSILQKYMVRKNLQNYTSGAVVNGGRDLPPCPTAVGRRVVL